MCTKERGNGAAGWGPQGHTAHHSRSPECQPSVCRRAHATNQCPLGSATHWNAPRNALLWFPGDVLPLPLMLFTLFSQFILLLCSSKEADLWNPTYSIPPDDYGTLEDTTQMMPSELVVSRSSRTPWSRSLDSNLTVKTDKTFNLRWDGEFRGESR